MCISDANNAIINQPHVHGLYFIPPISGKIGAGYAWLIFGSTTPLFRSPATLHLLLRAHLQACQLHNFAGNSG